jgi:hypothetical protein
VRLLHFYDRLVAELVHAESDPYVSPSLVHRRACARALKGTYFKVDGAKQYVECIRDTAANETTWLMLLEDYAWVCHALACSALRAFGV